MSTINPTLVNAKPIKSKNELYHLDVITIVDRSFRFEFPIGSARRGIVAPSPVHTPSRYTPSRKALASPKRTPFRPITQKVLD